MPLPVADHTSSATITATSTVTATKMVKARDQSEPLAAASVTASFSNLVSSARERGLAELPRDGRWYVHTVRTMAIVAGTRYIDRIVMRKKLKAPLS